MSSDGRRGGRGQVSVEREFSAGGVVFRDGRCIVIVPTRRAKGGERVLALPKGHPEEGETGADAALREIREETGVEARLIEKLGDVATGTSATASGSRRSSRSSSSPTSRATRQATRSRSRRRGGCHSRKPSAR
jgi:ADP-ribose pyrophosphatase